MQPISIFSRMSIQGIDINNIKVSLSCISDFIIDRYIKNNREINILCLEGFGKVAFEFVKSIYKGGQVNLLTENGSKSFCNKIREEFTIKVPTILANRKTDYFPFLKPMEFTNIPPPTSPPKLTKEEGYKPKSVNKSKENKSINLFPQTGLYLYSSLVCQYSGYSQVERKLL